METVQLNLDALDLEIVNTMSHEPELTNRAIAARLGLAESTFAFRLKRLRDAGVLGARRPELNYAQLGYPITAVVLVYLTRHSREIVDDFLQRMTQQPNVLSVMNLTGRYDFMVTVAVRDPEHLRTFVLDHVTVLPSVRGTETQIVFSVQPGRWVPGDEA